MPIKQLHIWLASAPALVMHQHETPAESGKHGTILFYHGHGTSKESHAADLVRFAQAGYLAIGIDNVGHGERRYNDFASRFPDPSRRMEEELIYTVQATASEVPLVIDTLLNRGWASEEHIGIAGASMGAMITYAAIVADTQKRICAAAPITGSPVWLLPHPDSPHLHLNTFFPTALLSQNAEHDRKMPASLVRDFHRWLAPYYASAPQRLRYIEYPDCDHELSTEVWQQIWQNTLHWFNRFLASRSA